MQVQLIVGYRLKWKSVYDLGEDAGFGYLKLVELFREYLLRGQWNLFSGPLPNSDLRALLFLCTFSKYLADILHSWPHS